MVNKGNILMQKYDIGKMLGQGNFAKVYHGRDLNSGQSLAIKVIDKEKVLKAGLIEQTKREISAMRLVKHPNIVQLYEVMATKTKIYFAMEFAKGGELFNKVAKGRLKENIARKYFQQLISAVDFCHSRGIYHRDLKLENLLLDENGNLKVTDFGLSALVSCKRQDGLLHTSCGTPAYVAPEVISRKGYDGAKSDIWSCGVILFVVLAGYLPFQDSNLMQMYRKISKATYKCPIWFPPEVRSLLLRILDPNPVTRISTKEIMENSWFRRGLDSKQTRNVEKELPPSNADIVSGPADRTPFELKNPDFAKVTHFNAFDIISLSSGFDLSSLFVENKQTDEVKFTSTKPASVIISTMDQIATRLNLEVGMKKGGLLNFRRAPRDINGPLSIDVEIFEINSSPSLHLVVVKKTDGDALEYQKILRQDIRPALEETVLAWHGEQ